MRTSNTFLSASRSNLGSLNVSECHYARVKAQIAQLCQAYVPTRSISEQLFFGPGGLQDHQQIRGLVLTLEPTLPQEREQTHCSVTSGTRY